MFGIKFKPAGIWRLLGIAMSMVKNRVVPFNSNGDIQKLYRDLKPLNTAQRVRLVDNFLLLKMKDFGMDVVDKIILTIESHKGDLSVEEICYTHDISQRKLQRIFRERVGIPAKQYARIVRFRNVYALLQKPSLTKSDSVFLSGYFDQPHFNKEFRQFTDDNPQKWFRGSNTFSNFFMNR